MLKKEIIKTLNQDIQDLQGLINHDKYCISDELLKKQARAISLNIQEHIIELVNKV